MSLPPVDYDVIQRKCEFVIADRFENDYVEDKIEEAIDLILEKAPTAAARLRSGLLPEARYQRVVAEVVLRVIRNPAGYRVEHEGDTQVENNLSHASGKLYLTDEDLERLTGIVHYPAVPGTASLGLDPGWSR